MAGPKEVLSKFVQRAIGGPTPPLIIVGSGLSVGAGISGMSALADHLDREIEPAPDDAESWRALGDSIQTMGLELALQQHPVSREIHDRIVHETRRLITADDLRIYASLAQPSPVQLPLARLLGHLFSATDREIHVVTTNYDRLIEYAVESVAYPCDTGFSGRYLQHRTSPRPIDTLHPVRTKRVRLAKVHGSIDWFKAGSTIRSLPVGLEYPADLVPLMVTPGTGKYQETHQEPYRSVLTLADDAIRAAHTVVCLGYGFNDEHIHPVLAERAKRGEVSVIILARALTEAANRFIADECEGPLVAVEESGDGAQIVSTELHEPFAIASPVWSLDAFLDYFVV